MAQVVGVRFERAGKIYYFEVGGLELSLGDSVIVESSRGLDFGTVATPVQEVANENMSQPLRPVMRKATIADEKRYEDYQAKEPEAFEFCREQILAAGLPMKLIRAAYSFDGSKIVFYFTSDNRVDFRDLVKVLAAHFHARIELRQVGVRDEARLVGGYSSCGRELCCAAFLNGFHPVSIKMAKKQNLALNPAKISGVCGRLMCCLYYEYDENAPDEPERAKPCDNNCSACTDKSCGRMSDELDLEQAELVAMSDEVTEKRERPEKRERNRNRNNNERGNERGNSNNSNNNEKNEQGDGSAQGEEKHSGKPGGNRRRSRGRRGGRGGKPQSGQDGRNEHSASTEGE